MTGFIAFFYLWFLFLIISIILTVILLLIRGFGKANFSWFIPFIPLLISILTLVGVLIGAMQE
jgi:hypothetical protein